MAKFCGKCGTKLDEKTGLCPKCEKENIAQENVEQKNVVLNRKQRRKEKRKERKNLKKERRIHWSVWKKIRRFLVKLVGYILGLGILILGVIGILTYYKLINVPFISDWINQYVIKKQIYVESVEREVPETDIVNMMLAKFDQVVKDNDIEAQAKKLNHTLDDAVIIASLIEGEVKYAPERTLVSSVIYNRLAKNMKLQLDDSVIYSMGKRATRVLYSDLKNNDKHNTYVVDGLPVGPINSPSEDLSLIHI